MEQELEIEVKIVSNEIIKSTHPPSSPPKSFTLSFLDQIFPPLQIPILLYYTPTPPTQPSGRVDILGLKTSLSQTLDKFYPLAGRLLDESTISCNNHGIPFIETQVNSNLSLVMNSPHKLNVLTKFLPPLDLQDIPPLAFQINVFLCGGVVIGCYMLHKLLDAASLATFLNYWASLASKNCYDLIDPDFESIIKVFPPLPTVEKLFVPDELSKGNSVIEKSNDKIVVKSFKFSTLALNNLKAKAASELVPQPSRFEALVGFIWEQNLTVTKSNVEKTKLSFTVNMRPRMTKPLPKESIGNVLTTVQSEANAETSKIQDFVKEIRKSLSEINEKIKKVYEGENGAEIIWQEWNSVFQNVMEFEKGFYRLTSWCNMGLKEVDFGFGKPVWIVPTCPNNFPPPPRNFIVFTECSDGIEVWLFLEEKEMQILESNPYFLEFASN